jgi:integrase
MLYSSPVSNPGWGKFMAYLIDGASTPNTVNSSVARTREYLSRYGHRDATMILIAYRHGLRASEVCDLQWHQVEINSGRLRMCLPQSVAGRLRRKASTR